MNHTSYDLYEVRLRYMKVETAINDQNIDLITKQRFQFGAVKLRQAIDQPSSLFNPIQEVLETIQEEIAA